MRERVVAAARGWIGTPYRHRASCKGAGADCLGLVRGVWRELVGEEPEIVPAYSPLWAEARGGERLRAGLARHLVEVAVPEAAAGDVVLFRFRSGAPAKHAAVLSGVDRMIHAYGGHAVAETALGPWWRRRLAFAFGFPERPLPPLSSS
jgi:NlpC/P60 family putative phage cell wall peptidase